MSTGGRQRWQIWSSGRSLTNLKCVELLPSWSRDSIDSSRWRPILDPKLLLGYYPHLWHRLLKIEPTRLQAWSCWSGGPNFLVLKTLYRQLFCSFSLTSVLTKVTWAQMDQPIPWQEETATCKQSYSRQSSSFLLFSTSKRRLVTKVKWTFSLKFLFWGKFAR